MKKIFTLALLSCLSIHVGAQTEYTFAPYEDPVLITQANAQGIDTFDSSIPESVVTYFYASKIRGDRSWEEVLPDKKSRSERLKRKLLAYEEWKIIQFKLVGQAEAAKNKLWVKIFMVIEYQGKTESGEDEVTIERIDGKWIITSIPT